MIRDTEKEDHKDLIDGLRRIDLEQVPGGLTREIMERIDASERSSKWSRIRKAISAPVTFTVRPTYALAIALLVCLSFVIGRVSVEPELAVVQAPVAVPEVEGAEASYLMGRALLESEEPTLAAEKLHKASMQEPRNAEYAYWAGVAYWRSGQPMKERLSYQRGLEVDPESVPLLVNLAHNYLSQKEYPEALEAYKAVLEVAPEEPSALYNIGLISRQLGKVDDEKNAWKAYLDVVRNGKFAFRAVERLNSYGDFSYRQYRVGVRKIIVAADALLGNSVAAEEVSRELAPLAATLESDTRLLLDIVVFNENDSDSAHERALLLKDKLMELTHADLDRRVRLSWFAEAETVERTGKEPVELAEGLLIFSTIAESKREV